MEIINNNKNSKDGIVCAVFDFDGTISTLRAKWEGIMEPLMLGLISPNEPPTKELVEEVRNYIEESTGIQTAYQMEWFANKVKSYGQNPEVHNLWWYKDKYNDKLLDMVNDRLKKIENNILSAEDFRIKGSLEFIKKLHKKGVKIYIASGTDDTDLQKEIKVLGLYPYIKEAKGAPNRQIACSKEKVLEDLLKNIPSEKLAIFGDGKVEIELGAKNKAITIGTATDEIDFKGVNPIKRAKLIKAGSDVIIGDFSEQDEILKYLGL